MIYQMPMRKILDLLKDHTVDLGGRDDIVLLLSDDGDETALDTLYEIASQPKNLDDIELMSGCGEAIARIMCRADNFQLKYIKGLLPLKGNSGLHSALSSIKLARPDWYEKYNLQEIQKTKFIKNIEPPK